MRTVIIEKYIKPSFVSRDGKTREWKNVNGELHRFNDYPALISNGMEIYYINGLKHRNSDRPAVLRYEESVEFGEIVLTSEEYWFLGKLHREGDKPAVKFKNGSYVYVKNGLTHRDGDKPAYSNTKINEIKYFKNGLVHRHNKPAIIRGFQEYYYNEGEYLLTRIGYGNRFINFSVYKPFKCATYIFIVLLIITITIALFNT